MTEQNTCFSCNCLLTPSEQTYCDDCISSQNQTEEEDGEEPSFILADPRYTYDEETGQASYLAGWNYELPEGYRLRTAIYGAPINAAFPVFEVRGMRTPTSEPQLIGYACRPVATVYEGEIYPYKPNHTGPFCYSIEEAEGEAARQLAAMDEEGYYD